ncbi:STAS domain-containing protein [Mycobacterium sp. CVI_P3]|uniref:Anti-sigma factor antagonist n=1 Tax=Mycobacterium pinniadriaticum TaxID=2994102 RepID=A0ABT3SIE0_9MYCO|nr:STAS domain-containing protein [Mycobacterium pinniadriaticum]MCX2932864.1 STAS domain-containing protein [Mycobacterium pinniadriaticum]MCX2939287.1 STAS domain-containing protein [Mycobacterium pinniadriaticum]
MDEQTIATTGTTTAANTGCVINEEWFGRTAVISASGVVDMLTSPQLETSIATALKNNPTAIIVDLTDVDFLASAGMGVLVAARDKASAEIGFGVVASGPATSRPLKLVGLADIVGLYDTLEEARAALGE